MKSTRLLFVLLTTACSAGPTDASPPGSVGVASASGSGIPASLFCDEYAAAACEADARCCPTPDMENCLVGEGVHCRIFFDPEELETEYDPVAAQQYLEELREKSSTCDRSMSASPKVGITRTHQLQIGEECRDWSERPGRPDTCTNGYCSGVCQAWKEAGEECDSHSQCGDLGLCDYWNDGPRSCMVAPVEGERCSPGHWCGVGYWCGPEDTCRSGGLPDGEACIDDLDCRGICQDDSASCVSCQSNEDCDGYVCLDGECTEERELGGNFADREYCAD